MKPRRSGACWLGFGLALAAAAFAAGNDHLVWSDEFDTKGLPDPAKWSYDVGANDAGRVLWGNNEPQFYTGGNSRNAWVDSGTLRITLRKEDTVWKNRRGVDTTSHFTSARLTTRGKAAWKYGKVEARLKLPRGSGLWPAFWMIPPSNNPNGNWPTSGEIDILENWGFQQTTMYATLHMAGNATVGNWALAEYPNDSFHVYTLDWRPDTISVAVDGRQYLQYVNPHTGLSAWPFDQPFHIILNIAIDIKTENGSAAYPQSMVADWVRVYQPDTSTSIGAKLPPHAATPGWTWRSLDGRVLRSGSESEPGSDVPRGIGVLTTTTADGVRTSKSVARF